MAMPKKPIVAIGGLSLATGAVAWQPALPTFQKLLANGYEYWLTPHLWRYPVILTAVVVEGPIATVLGGVWVALGWVNFWLVLSVAMLAGILADTFWYYVGYFGREQVVKRWGRFAGVEVETIHTMAATFFDKNAAWLLFTAKLTSTLIIPALIAAGLANMGWRRMLRAVIAPQLLWSTSLTMLGAAAAESYLLISQKVEYISWIGGVFIGLLIMVRFIMRNKKVKGRH